MSVLLQADPAAMEAAISNAWILVVSFLIFFMHAGFAMLEAGQVRSKNVANQLTKNLLTWSVGVLLYFLVGAGVAAYVGGMDPMAFGTIVDGSAATAGAGDWIGWLYGAVFAMTAATIVSGAVAGRAKLRAYVTYTIILAAIIYPVVQGMIWSTNYVTELLGFPYVDFAGGVVVHGMGGIAGLTAAWILGPRIGRYNDDGSANVIPGHSLTFAVLGTLLLAFGWYGFNVGTAGIFDGSAMLGRIAMGTTLAMGCGAIGAAAVAWAKTGKVDTLYVANGLLAGLVGITAIPHTTAWWGAIVVGLIAGAQLPIVFSFVEKRLKIDDVCAVFPVHGSAGVLGALLAPFVANRAAYEAAVGGTYGIGEAFLSQVVGVALIAGWTILATAAVWGALKAMGQARVTPEHENEGLDISEHGVDTYPEFGGDDGVAADGGEVVTDGGRAIDGGLETDGGVATDGDVRTDGGVRTDGSSLTDRTAATDGVMTDGDVKAVRSDGTNTEADSK